MKKKIPVYALKCPGKNTTLIVPDRYAHNCDVFLEGLSMGCKHFHSVFFMPEESIKKIGFMKNGTARRLEHDGKNNK